MAQVDALEPLLVKELQDILDAEKQLTRAIPKMARAATSPELKAAFQEHLQQTDEQRRRVEQALGMLGAPVRGKPCHGMKGLVEEGQEAVAEIAAGPVRDAALIVSAQKVEHYEIASYGSVKAFAQLLNRQDVVRLLDQTLEEEKATDKKLTALAEGDVNVTAATQEPGTESAPGLFGRAASWVREAIGEGAPRKREGRRASSAKGTRTTAARKTARSRGRTGSRGARKTPGGARGGRKRAGSPARRK